MESASLLKKLIRAKTENPPGDEFKVVKIAEQFFRKHRISYKTFSKTKGRESIIGFIGKGRPHLLISCHADTVPAGDGWKTNPFRPAVKNGRIYGRGAVDDKGPMAAMLCAAGELKKNEKQLKGTLLVCIAADEEKGSVHGMGFLLNQKKIDPDFAIFLDVGGSMRKITIAEKGILRLELVSIGKAAHGSAPELGVNAITNLSEALVLLKGYVLGHKKHRLFSAPTINVGQIEGGIRPNMVPASAKATLDIRYLPSQTPQQIIKEIQSIVQKARKKNRSINVTVKRGWSVPPTVISQNNPLVSAIRKAAKEALGSYPSIEGESGATDAKSLVLRGIPAVGFSCGEFKQMHAANESIKIKELEQFSEVLAEVVGKVLSVRKR